MTYWKGLNTGCTLPLSADQCREVGASWTRGYGPVGWVDGDVVCYPLIEHLHDAGDETRALAVETGALLGCNEPDMGGGRDMAEVVALWKATETCAPWGVKLVSPQPSHLHARDWLPAFWQAFTAEHGRPPRVRVLGLHSYLDADEAVNLCEWAKGFVAWANAEYASHDREWRINEIWFTEIAWPTYSPRINQPYNPWIDRSFQEAFAQGDEFLAYALPDPLITRLCLYASSPDPAAWYCGDGVHYAWTHHHMSPGKITEHWGRWWAQAGA